MPPIPATEQVRRLLVMIPWLTARGRVSLDDLAKAFGISVTRAEADVNQASMIGVPPYTGGYYVDVYLDEEGTVEAHPGPYLTRAPQLSAAQGFALLTSARALLDGAEVQPDSPLASALAKLADVLGDENIVDVDLQSPPNLRTVQDAVDDGTQLHVEYYTAYRDELTDRVIEPHVVFQRHGRWYTEANCHRAGGMRRFRIDRFRMIEPTGESFTPVRAEPPDEVFTPRDDTERVVLDLPLDARWVVEAYHPDWEERDGRLLVTINVLGTPWLERLLLKVGADAHVVEPASMRSVGADAATRLLDAY